MTVRALLCVLALAAAVAPTHVLAWGATGHEYVSGVAAETLPDEVPAFVRTPEAVASIAVFGRELDRSKGSGLTHDSERDPGHYVDLTDDGAVAGVFPLELTPPTREAYDTALRRRGFTQYKIGYLPLSIVDGWQQLVKDFAYWRAASVGARTAASAADRTWFDQDRKRREMLTIRDLGVWSHYPGDASQPLHVSMHFDGWGPFPNPRGFSTRRGIHAHFEGAFVRANVQRTAVLRDMPTYRTCLCTIQDRARAVILGSHREVVPFYELEKAGAFTDGNAAGIAFATARLVAGAAAARDMIVDAWRASSSMGVGYPMISVRDIESGKHVLTRDDFGRD
ncbi:MAG: S1/P1 Nuclease [Proteobacteria bacterium]|nr:S1/P1 Nuclease [Pseudomonadota bacterium]